MSSRFNFLSDISTSNLVISSTATSGDTNNGALVIGGSLSVGGLSNFSSNLNVHNNRITNIGTPINSSDAVSKSYVDLATASFGANGTFSTLVISGTTNSTNTADGALIVNGGIGVSGNVNIGGNLGLYYDNIIGPNGNFGFNNLTNGNLLEIQNTNANKYSSIEYLNESNVSIGSIGAGNSNASNSILQNNLYINSNNAIIYESVLNQNWYSGNFNSLTLSNTGIFSINSTVNSVSTSSGALNISGGVSIAKSLFLGGVINMGSNKITNVANPTNSQDVSSKNYVDTATASIANGNANFSSLNVSGTTNSTSVGTGSVLFSGGLSVNNNIYSGGIINSNTYTFIGSTNPSSSGTFIGFNTTSGSSFFGNNIGSGSIGGYQFGNYNSSGTISNIPLTMLNSGFVGINNPNPSYQLDVSGGFRATNFSAIVSANFGLSYNQSIVVLNGSVNNFTNSNLITTFSDGTFDCVSFGTPGNNTNPLGVTRIHMKSNGNVGINTTNPSSNLDINGSARISGVLISTNTTVSSSITSGSFQLAGGLGVSGNIYGQNLYQNGNQVFSVNGTNISSLNGTVNVISNPTFSGIVSITNSTVSTNTLNGALIVSGGISSGNLNTGSLNASNFNVTSLSQIQLSGNSTSNAFNILQPSLSAGNNVNLTIGTSFSSGNAGFINFLNTTIGSNSNSMNFGIIGQPNAQITILNNGFVGINNSNPIYNLDIIGSVRTSGINYITNGTNSSNTSSGALQIIGGIGAGGNIYASNVFQNGIQVVNIAGTNTSISAGIVSVISNPTFSGITIINNTTNSNNTSNGALVVQGGIAVGGNIYASNIFQNGTQVISLVGSNLINLSGTISVISNPSFSGIVTISNSSVSTNTSTGALVVSGGISVNSSSYFGNIINLGNNKITNLATPTNPQDAVNKTYVDTATAALSGGNATFTTLIVNGTTQSISTGTGSVQIYGGLGIGGNIYSSGNIISNNIFQNGSQVVSIAGTNVSTSSGILSVISNPTFSGILTVSNTTNSTSTSSGAVVIAGGLGVSGSMYASNIFQNGNKVVSIAGTNTSTSNGILSVISNPSFSGIVNITNTSSAVSTITGALQIVGGIMVNSASLFNNIINMNSNKITNLTTPTNASDASNKSYVDTSISSLSGSAGNFSSIIVTGTAQSNSTGTGAVQIYGGLGLGGNIYSSGNINSNNIFQNGSQVVSIAGTNVSTSNGILSVISNPSFLGLSVTNSISSASLSTSNLQVTIAGSASSNSVSILQPSLLGSLNVNIGNTITSGNSGYIAFNNVTTNSTSNSFSLGILGNSNITFQNNGNVGINNTNPTYNLDLIGTSRHSGIAFFSNTTNSISTSTGSVIINGGLGVSSNISAGNVFQNGVQVISIAGTNIQVSNGIVSVVNNPTFTGSVNITNTANSTNTASGALIVNGGLGVGGNIYGSNLYQNNTQVVSIAGTNTSISNGILSIISNPSFSGIVNITNNTASTNTLTGAFIVSGGISVNNSSYFGNVINMGNNKITNLATPTNPQDVANKSYVDTATAAISGGNSTFTSIIITGTAQSTSTGTGSVQVYGGLGIGGNIFSSGNINSNNIYQNGSQVVSIAGTNVSTSSGILSVISNPTFSGILTVTNTTNSNGTNSGAIVVAGGLSVAGNMYGSNIFQNGNQVISIAGTNISTSNGIVSVISNPSFSGIVTINNTSSAVSTITGALQILGGIMVNNASLFNNTLSMNFNKIINLTTPTNPQDAANKTYVDMSISNLSGSAGNFSSIIVTGTTQSTSTGTGSVQIYGGLGIGGNIYSSGNINSNNIFQNGSQVVSIAGTNVSTSSGILSVISNPSFSGIVNITNSTNSSNTGSGALVVVGGLGINGSIYGSNIFQNGNQVGSVSGSNILISNGIINVITNPTFSGILTVSNTNNAVSTSTGALQILGGLSVVNTSYFGSIINLGNNKIINLATPTNPQDASNKSYVDTSISNLSGSAGNFSSILVTGTTQSISTGTGSVQIYGGLGIGGNIYSSGSINGNTVFQNGNQVASIAGTNISTSAGILSVISNPSFSGIVNITNATNSSNTASGALIIAGGLGISGNLYGSTIFQNASQVVSIAGTNTSISAGILSVISNPSFSGIVTISNTSSAISTITGALQILGGIMVNSASLFNSIINMNSNKITSLATPTNAQDAVNKSYVDTATASLNGSSAIFSSVIVNGTAQSTSTGTGSVQIYGGLGIGGNIFSSGNVNSNNIFQNGNQVFSITGTNTSSSNGIISVISNPSFSGIVNITNATSSNSTATGALIVNGGVGITGSIYSGNQYQNGNQVVSIAGTNTSTSNGILSIISNPSFAGIVSINNTSASTSTNTGALQVLGGISVGNSSYFTSFISMNNNKIVNLSTPTNPQDASNKTYVDTSISNLYGSAGNFSSIIVTGTAQSISTGTGAVQIYGGLGIGGNISAGNVFQNGVQVISIAGTNISTSNGIVSVVSNPSFSGIVNITNATSSSSITTGALVLSGGLGISGSLYGSNIFQNGSQVVSIAGTNTSISAGIVSVISNPSFSGVVNITNSSTAVSTITGALQILGGIMVNSASLFNSTINMNSNKIINLATPTNAQDAVNKSYVDTATAALSGGTGTFSSLLVNGTAQSTSTGTGTVQIYGGLGIGGNIFSSGNINSNNIFQNGNQVFSISGTNTSSSNGILSVISNPSFSGIVNITNTTIATNTATGALVIVGGLGISGNMYGSSIFQNGNQVISIAGTNISSSNGIVSVISNPNFSGITTISNSTVSTATGTGALVISGGISSLNNINATGSINGSALSAINLSASGVNSITSFQPNMTMDGVNNTGFFIGASASNANCGFVTFQPTGSGNANNRLNLGLYGAPYSISIQYKTAQGFVGINNVNPAYQLDINGTVNTTGITTINNNTASISTSTGALIVSGGLGVSGSIYSGNHFQNGNQVFSIAGTNVSSSNGILSVVSNPTFSGILTIANTTNAVNVATGSIVTSGGMGVGGNLYASNIYQNGSQVISIAGTNVTTSNGIVSVVSNPSFSGIVTINNTSIAVSTITGALQILGGIMVNSASLFNSTLSMNSNKITSLATPTNAQDAVNKTYVDTSISSLSGSAGNFSSILVTGTTQSNSTGTGSVQIYGGLGIGGNIFSSGSINGNTVFQNGNQVVSIAGTNTSTSNGILSVISNPSFSGIVNVTNTTNSSSTSTGALIIAGGIGISGNLYGSILYQNGNQVASIAGTNVSISSGIVSVIPNPTFSGIVTLNNTTNSSNTATGSIVIVGGLGISGSLYGSNIYQNSNQIFSIAGTNLSSSNGIVSVVNNPIFSGVTSISNTIQSSSISTGALIVSGGVGIASNLNVGGNLNVTGNFYVAGTTTSISSSIVNITDNILTVNSGPSGTSDAGYLTKRYQTFNNAGTGDVVTDISTSTGIVGTSGNTSTTINLNVSASAINNYYNGWWLKITSGTGSQQVRQIKSYVGSTNIATIFSTTDESSIPQTPPTGSNFSTTPDNTSNYALYQSAFASIFYRSSTKEWVLNSSATISTNTLSIDNYQKFHSGQIIAEGAILINNSSISTGTGTGALQVLGGISVSNSSYFASLINMSNNKITNLATPTVATDASTKGYVDTALTTGITNANFSTLQVSGNSTLSGALQVTGTLQVSGNTNLANIYQNGNQVLSIPGTNVSISNGIVSVISNPTFASIIITNTNPALATNSGALQIYGGISVTNSSYFSSLINMNSNKIINLATPTNPSDAVNKTYVDSSISGLSGSSGTFSSILVTGTTQSISTGTGSVQIYGGLGIGGNIYSSGNIISNNIFQNGSQVVSIAGTNTSTSNGILSVISNPSFSGIVNITNSTSSSSVTTGALIILGGLGITGSIYGSNIYQNGNQVVSIAGTNVSTSSGILSVVSNPSFSGIVNITNATNSSSITSGSLIIAGGVGISGNLYGSTIFQNGNQVVSVAGTNTSTSNGILSIISNPTFSGIVTINNTSSAVSTITGALQISGGIMVNSASLFNNTISLNNNKITSLATPTNPQDAANKSYVDTSISSLSGSAGNFSSIIVTGTTQSISTGTGSVQIYGGLGIGGNIYSSGNIISNNIFQNGNQVVSIAGTNTSTSNGILSVISNPSFSGIVNITNSTTSNSITTGSLIIAGGLGISGSIYSGNHYQNGNQVISIAGTNTSTSNGILSVISNPSFSGIVTISNTNSATSTITGALQISGGIMVNSASLFNNTINMNSNKIISLATPTNPQDAANKSYVDTATASLSGSSATFSSIIVTGTTQSTSTGTGSVQIYGGLGIGGNIFTNGTINGNNIFQNGSQVVSIAGTNVSTSGGILSVISNPSFSGIVTITNATSSSSITTGALVISGGLGISGSLYGSSIFQNGNQVVSIAGTNISTSNGILSVISNPSFAGSVTITNSTASLSTVSGALQILGGISVGNSSYFTGIINMNSNKIISLSTPTNAQDAANKSYVDTSISNLSGSAGTFSSIIVTGTTQSTSTGTGSVQIYGGLGIGGNIFTNGTINGNNIFQNGSQVVSIAGTNVSTSNGILSVISNPSFSGIVNITNATSSSSITTGALVISGGLGISGSIYGSTIFQSGNQVVSIAGTNTSTSGGILSVISNPSFSGIVTISNTNSATSTNTGALQILGGIMVNSASLFNSTINMNSNKIISLATPINPQDAVNKSYVDTATASLSGTSATFSSLIVNGTVQSVSTGTGSVQIYGGLGIGGNIFTNGTINGNNIFQNGSQVVSIAGTNVSTSNGILSVISNPSFSGIVNITNTTNSSTITSGALVISGGLGVSGNLYGSNIYQNGSQVVSIAGTNTSISNGIVSVIANPSFSGITTITNTNASISTSTGALQVLGGLSVVNTSYFGSIINLGNNKITSLATPTNAQDATNKSYVDTSISNLSGSAGNFSSIIVTGTTQSSSTGTGSVQIYGGLGIGGNIFTNGTINSNNIFQNGSQVVSIAGTNVSTSNGILSVISNPTFSGILTITNSTNAVNVATGSIVTVGGMGIGGNLYASTIFQNGSQVISIAGTNTSTSNGILSVISNPSFSGIVNITNTSSAVSTITGALQISGGIMVNSASLFNNIINMNSNKITNLATPTNAQDAVNKIYVDTATAALSGGSGTFSSLIVNGTVQSTSTGTGSVQIYGGLGIGGNIFTNGTINGNNIFQNGSQVVSIAGTNVSTSNGILSVISNPTFSGLVTVNNNLVVSGGITAGALSQINIAGTSSSTALNILEPSLAIGTLNVNIGTGLTSGNTGFINFNNVATNSSNNSLSIGVLGSSSITLQNNGNFGINNTSPTYNLDLIGTSRFSGIALFNNTANSVSNSTGSVVINGGLGVANTINASTIFQNSNQVISIAGTNTSTSNGILSVISNPSFSGIVNVTNTTSSSSITTGALVVNGGVGISGSIYGSTIFQSGNQVVSIAGTNVSTSGGILSVISNPSFSGIVTISNTNSSTSTITGALQISGGIMVNSASLFNNVISLNNNKITNLATPTNAQDAVNKSYVDTATASLSGSSATFSSLIINGTTQSTSTGTGSVQIYGGLGIGGNIFTNGTINGNNIFQNGSQVVSIAGTNTSTSGGILSVVSNPSFSGIVTITNATSSSSITTGSLVLSGGLGISGSLYGSNIYQNGSQVVSIAGTNTSTSGGILSIISNPSFSGIVTISNTNSATSTITGALQISGGIMVNSASLFNSTINMNSNKIIGVSTPTNAQDAANKSYVDTATAALSGGTGTFSSLIVNGTTQSTSTGTGSVQIYGGLGIGGNIFTNGTINSNNIFQNGNQVFSIAGTNTSSSNGILSVISNPSFSGIVNITNTTNATNTATGSLVIAGGLSVAGNMYGSSIFQNGNQVVSIAGTNVSSSNGIVSVISNPNFSGITTISNSTISTATGNGALLVSGGISSLSNINATGSINGSALSAINLSASGVNSITSFQPNMTMDGVNNTGFFIGASASNANCGFITFQPTGSGNANNRLNFGLYGAPYSISIQYKTAQGFVGINNINPAYQLDINGTLNTTGITTINNNTASVGTSTGALIISGGLGVSGSIYSGNHFQNGNQVFSIAGTNVSSSNGILSVVSNPTFSGIVTVNNNLVVSGNVQVSISGTSSSTATSIYQPNLAASSNIGINIGTNSASGNAGYINFLNTTAGSVSNSMNFGINGLSSSITVQNNGFVGINNTNPSYTLDVSGTSRISGVTLLTNATNSGSTSTGSLVLNGGIGLSGNIYAGGSIFQNGTQVITIAGTNISTSNGIISVISNPTFSGNVSITSATNAVNTSSGALTVSGGIGIGGNVYASNIFQNGLQVSSISGTNISISNGITSVISNPTFTGIVTVNNTTVSTNTGSGALTIAGGLGVNGSIYGNNIYQNGNQVVSIAGTNTSISNGIVSVISNPSFSGVVNITNSTNSTNTSTGALTVLGGIGAGSIYGQNIFQNGSQTVSIAGTNISISSGIASVISNPTFSGIVNLTSTTNSNSVSTGSLILAGGLGISGNLYSTGLFQNGNQVFSIAGTNVSSSNGTISIIANPTFSGITTISNSTVSNSVTSGALTVAGGLGVSGAIYGTSIVSNSISTGSINANFLQLNIAGSSTSTALNIFEPNLATGSNVNINIGSTTGSGNAGYLNYSTGLFNLGVVGSSNLSMSSLGYVGINNTSPAFNLDVIGTGNFGSTITIANTSNPVSNIGGTVNINGDVVTNSKLLFSQAITPSIPTFTTRSTGTKIIYYPSIYSTSVDYASGISSNSLWHSIPVNSSTYSTKWYAGTTNVMTLDGTGSLSLANNLTLNGSSSGFIALKASSTTTSYTLTFPNAVSPSSGQSLVSDNTGKLSWQSIPTFSATSFTATQNASSASVTGLTFNGQTFTVTLIINIVATTNLTANYTLEGVQNGAGSWLLSSTYIGDTTGIVFSLNSSGQLLYSSPSFAGLVSITFVYTMNNLGTVSYNTSVISGNNPSNSTNSGALQVVGGVGIGGNINIGGSVSFAGAQISTPTTGSTITSNGNPILLVNGSSTLATLTIVFPTSPNDGQLLRINSNPAITSLTITNAIYPSNESPPASLSAGGNLFYYYNSSSGLWWRLA